MYVSDDVLGIFVRVNRFYILFCESLIDSCVPGFGHSRDNMISKGKRKENEIKQPSNQKTFKWSRTFDIQ